jgi:hypothetical protein
MTKRKSAQDQIRVLRAAVLDKLARDDRARRHARQRRPGGKRWLRWLVFAAVVAAAVVSVWR